MSQQQNSENNPTLLAKNQLLQNQTRTPQTNNIYFPDLNIDQSRKTLSIQKKRPLDQSKRQQEVISAMNQQNDNIMISNKSNNGIDNQGKNRYEKSNNNQDSLILQKQSQSEGIQSKISTYSQKKQNQQDTNNSTNKLQETNITQLQHQSIKKTTIKVEKTQALSNEIKQLKKSFKIRNQLKGTNNIQSPNKFEELTYKNNNEQLQQDKLLTIGFASKQGQSSYINKVNQDRIVVKKQLCGIHDLYLMAVADGHGMNGHLVSKHIKQVLAQILEFEDKRLAQQRFVNSNQGTNQITSIFNLPENEKQQFQGLVKQLLQKVFYNVNKQIESQRSFDVQLSGSTLVVCIVSPTHIITANCGDSRCIVTGQDNQIIFETVDHKPNRPEEKQRIEQQYKGRVRRQGELHSELRTQNQNKLEDQPYRVWAKEIDMPGLAMSRSIGDSMSKGLGVIAEPDIQIIDYSSDKNKPQYVCLASDGIWDVIESKQLTSMLQQIQSNSESAENCKNTKDIVNHFVKEAHNLWVDIGQTDMKNSKPEIDDISIVLGEFNSQVKS